MNAMMVIHRAEMGNIITIIFIFSCDSSCSEELGYDCTGGSSSQADTCT